ncbi:four-carbon acid sugar kinase family protein [Mameliella alba]|uniref:four-carbon acid sugar kinase family protein n=1 Tax=Mameliella alba TaxID=561184 RepID=UPI00142F80B8|nr:four-carbon acid sugar kinase family protein [Mameliella alba]
MQDTAIIADDLTGALDSAAPLAGPARVVVATSVAALERALEHPHDILAVSTRSREIPAEQARARVARVLASLPGDIRLFKKVDSRLKGNIAPELSALPDRPLLVAPAIPDFGRIVRAGQVSGFGVDTPIDVAATLGGRPATIPDTLTAEDMRAALAAAAPGTILVGARGLALALRGDQPPAPVQHLDGPLTIAVGSTDPITLEQVAALRAARPALVHVTAPAGVVPPPPGSTAPVTLIQMTDGPETPPAEAAQRFAGGLAPWLDRAGTVVITGGATAEAALDAMGIDVMTVAGEILPGLPCCRVGPRSIVTKSGGFGTPDTFLRLAAMTEGARAHG